jgi:hypothetical protein
MWYFCLCARGGPFSIYIQHTVAVAIHAWWCSATVCVCVSVPLECKHDVADSNQSTRVAIEEQILESPPTPSSNVPRSGPHRPPARPHHGRFVEIFIAPLPRALVHRPPTARATRTPLYLHLKPSRP